MPPAISIESLEKFFPPTRSGWRAFLQPFAPAVRPALAGLFLDVEPGEAVALVGPNGAGKTTLLRILTTLLLPTRGRAIVAGFDIAKQPGRVRAKIGFSAGGDDGFYGRLSARENLQFFATMNGVSVSISSRRIFEMAELLKISDAVDRQVRTLSTGVIHRLGLARSLLHEPEILFLDEPTRSLDPLAASEFRRFLTDEIIRRRGTTLLFASHSLAEVEEVAHRVAFLARGRLLACDTVSRLLAAAGASTLEEALARFVDVDAPLETQP